MTGEAYSILHTYNYNHINLRRLIHTTFDLYNFLYNLQSMTKQNDVRADQLLKKLRSDPPISFLLLTYNIYIIYILTNNILIYEYVTGH